MKAEYQENSHRTKLVADTMQIQVVSVVPEMTVRELIHVLLEHGITGAPVLDPWGKVAGVVSMTDVLRLAAHEAEISAGQIVWQPALIAEELEEGALEVESDAVSAFTAPDRGALAEAALDQYQVRDIMTPVAFSVLPTDTLESAVRFMLQGRIHRALVVDRGVLHGIITPFDVMRALQWE